MTGESGRSIGAAARCQYQDQIPTPHSQIPTTHIESRAYLDCAKLAQYAEVVFPGPRSPLRITLNGEPYDLDEPLSVADLLVRLSIDARRVAVEHNLIILRRPLFTETLVHEGDRIEIVNFVGGG